MAVRNDCDGAQRATTAKRMRIADVAMNVCNRDQRRAVVNPEQPIDLP